MSSHRVLFPLLLSACVSSGSLGVDPNEPAPHARVSLVPVAGEDSSQLTPQAIDPQLPSADRMTRVIDARLGAEASLDVRFCVTPAGKVTSATLARSSTLQAFDDAVMSDVRAWQFAAQPGPESVQSCELATIVYRAHR